MKKGFNKMPKQNNIKDQVKELSVMVQNLQMVIRLMQLSLQQIMQFNQRADSDIANVMGMFNDIQYRTLAMLNSGSFNKNDIEKAAEEIKLQDYNKASDDDDKNNNYKVVDTVKNDSIVIITSTCPEDASKGIFRSKFKLDESGNADAIKFFPGKKVGDKVDMMVNGKNHIIEIIGVREKPEPPKEEVSAEAPTETSALEPAEEVQENKPKLQLVG